MANIIKKRMALAAGVLVLGVGAAAYLQAKQTSESTKSKYSTVIADIGGITQTVTATGTINPVALVNVGSQVSGTVSELNADFNDHVRKGQVLLKLTPTIFNAQIAQYEAVLASAQASYHLAEATFARNERLVAQNYMSSLSLDQAKRERDVAFANIKMAEAQLARARADLDNSVIRAPIDGVIIKRTIDLGQTVAASFTTPNLFQIARDLTKMQIETNVSEADVGALKEGQEAHFVVDAYPNREFNATLRQFRLAAVVNQGTVTYTVVLDVDNKDELLKPGMTAQVRLVVGNRQQVLRIPTAALRFRLPDEEQQKLDKARARPDTGVAQRQATVTASDAEDDVAFRSKDETTRSFKIFKLDDKNQALPVDVRIGLSNFRFKEVVSGELKKGDHVITRLASGNNGKIVE
jgi:HlyD family secretion protein